MRGAIAGRIGQEKDFRWRGAEVSRTENLSDAVFGFAITLLVVSLEVPRSFAQLEGLLREFVPFGACVAIMGIIWYAHYTFFRRYGLNDGAIMFLNTVLLFVVVFYLYPLKFLTTMLYDLVLPSPGMQLEISPAQGASLLVIYSAGYAAVFATLACFYLQAWRRRAALELSAVEVLMTKQSVAMLLVHVLCALLTMGCVAITGSGLSGGVYFLIGPLSFAVGVGFGRRIKTARTIVPAGAP
jgi:uncharacterized membrane protein